jgi:REP element-mobilizing transposase RayT
MDRRQNTFGAPKIRPNALLERSDLGQRKHSVAILDSRQRQVVEEAIRGVCKHRKYLLRAVNVRTNHAHSVVTALQKPDPILDAFKSYATRALRRAGLLSTTVRPWARQASTIYLWKERDVAKAVEYVMLGQGDELFTLDDD